MGQTASLIQSAENSILVDGLALVDSYLNNITNWSSVPDGFCKIADHVSNLRPRQHDSVSNSQIMFGKKQHEDVALKVFYQPPKQDNGLMIEGEIYEKVIQKMLEDKHTPNVLKFYAFAKCDPSLLQGIRDIVDPKYYGLYDEGVMNLENTKETKKWFESKPMACVLAIEKAVNCVNLHDWLQYPHSKSDISSVLFQVFYTLEVFNRYGLRHNDLHFGNILVCDTKLHNTFFEYDVDGDKYYIPMRW
jgi:hypothetical protein